MRTTTIYATRHVLERAMERIDLNRKEAIYNIKLALHKGKSYEQYNTSMVNSMIDTICNNIFWGYKCFSDLYLNLFYDF